MKRILTLILAFLLCAVLFVSCTDVSNKPDTGNKNDVTDTDDTQGGKITAKPDKSEKEDASLTELRNQISDSEAILGVAYLGYYDGTFTDIKEYLEDIGLYNEYLFVKDMDSDSFCTTGGSELYLVVPVSRNMMVEIYSGIPNFETYNLDKGELVKKTEPGKPVIVSGNVSDIISNIILECDEFTYSPCLSGEDGQLVENYGVYDFSPYAAINEYFGISGSDVADGADNIFCGSWLCEAENGDHELMTLNLSLYVDGTAEYVYGLGNSEAYKGFEGDWTYDIERDMILLDMFGGPFNDDFDSDEIYIDPYTLECGFKWYMDYRDDGTYLVLTHEEGDPILWGKNGATFEFVNLLIDDYEDYSYLYAT